MSSISTELALARAEAYRLRKAHAKERAKLLSLAGLWEREIAVAYNEYSHGQRAAYESSANALRKALGDDPDPLASKDHDLANQSYEQLRESVKDVAVKPVGRLVKGRK